MTDCVPSIIDAPTLSGLFNKRSKQAHEIASPISRRMRKKVRGEGLDLKLPIDKSQVLHDALEYDKTVDSGSRGEV